MQWEKSGTPIPRRPVDSFASHFDWDITIISLLEGSNGLALHQTEAFADMDVDDEEEDDHFIDMSRCEQLIGMKSQLYGCGLCVLWVMQASRTFPELGLAALLTKLDEILDESGLSGLIPEHIPSPARDGIIEKLGFAYRPRRFEVGQALTRLRGIELEEIPVEDGGSEEKAAAEAERKKRELMELWHSRRKGNPNKS